MFESKIRKSMCQGQYYGKRRRESFLKLYTSLITIKVRIIASPPDLNVCVCVCVCYACVCVCVCMREIESEIENKNEKRKLGLEQ